MERDHYSELVDQGVMSEEDANSARASASTQNPEEVESPQVENLGEPNNEPDGDQNGDVAPPIAGDETNVEPTEPFYKSLGFEKDDDVVLALNELNSFRSRVGEIQRLEADIKEKAAVIGKFESPYSHDSIGKLDKAYERLKIEDFSLLTRIVGMNQDKAKANPIEAIVVGKILANPSLLSMGISYDDLLQMENENREGVDLTDTTSMDYKRLVIESTDALTKINDFQQSLETTKGRYTFAHEETKAQEAKRLELQGSIQPKVEELMVGKKQKFESSGFDVEIGFTKDEISDIVKMATSVAVSNGVDINTTDGVKTLKEIVSLTAKGAAIRNSSYEKALIESVVFKTKTDMLKEESKGSPARRNPSQPASAQRQSESEAMFQKMLKDAGN